jgi:hypothetical protein
MTALSCGIAESPFESFWIRFDHILLAVPNGKVHIAAAIYA